MTWLFTAITTLCLIALVAFAAWIDGHSRSRALDKDLDRVAGALAREVARNDDGTLDLGDVRDDELAQGDTSVVVLSLEPDHSTPNGSVVWRIQWHHRSAALPNQAELVSIALSVAHNQETEFRSDTDTESHPIRLAAAPAYDNDDLTAVVVAALEPGPGEVAHRDLVLELVGGSAALALVSLFAGHRLSGRSMRPALRLLDEQERFLADAAHELRTPLSTLRLMTEAGGRDPAQAQRALSEARALTDRMARLVTGLLARSRTQTGVAAVELGPLRLDQLVESVVDDFPEADITLSTIDTVVAGDPDLLGLAIRNLVDNALTHGAAPDGTTHLEIDVGHGVVTVRDHGPGLLLDDDPFERGTTGAGGHTGIGLSLVRWVAQVHSGTATLTTAPDGGTLATFTLPEL